MAQKIPIREPKAEVLFALLAVFSLVSGVIMSLAVHLDNSSRGRIGLVTTAIVVGGFAVGWRLARRGRRWLTDTGSGFVYHSVNGAIKFDDHEVVGIGSHVLLEYASGVPVSAARVAVIATNNPVLPQIEVRYSFEPEADPLGFLFDRLGGQVRQESLATFAAGGEIRGSGWRLNADGLYVRAAGSERKIPFAHLVTAEVIDRHACVWGRSAPEPLVRVPEESLNAAILVEIIGTSDFEPELKSGFGRLLFERERRWSPSSLLLWWLGTLMLLGMGGTALINSRATGTLAFGAIASFLGVALSLYWFASRRTVLRAYANGLRVAQPLAEREVCFDEVISFAYSVVRQHVTTNHVTSYVGTFVVFRLWLRDRGTFCYEFSTTTRDRAVEMIRDRLARRLAAEWRRQVFDKKLRAWCSGVTFTYKGLSVPGRHGFVPYKQIAGWAVHDGICCVRGTDGTELATLLCSEPDFYPGLNLLDQLIAPKKEDES
ncbi:hypothetical protein R5W23_003063 [Gemmata sp. JC673]|uniref:RING-type E3 ubiquitin transferase n=1 Tax=Gemmata algarum TaxID=2975278 RepID=A0ABU5ES44_9BACT|nr:hypothetical protein [Gemmata algarum]